MKKRQCKKWIQKMGYVIDIKYSDNFLPPEAVFYNPQKNKWGVINYIYSVAECKGMPKYIHRIILNILNKIPYGDAGFFIKFEDKEKLIPKWKIINHE